MSDEIEELLAAPDSVRKNQAELRKYHSRKATEKQEAERLRAEKSGDIPSLEDILEDVIRTAEDKDTNPLGWRLKQISESRYRQYGWYPVEFLWKHCGQFQHALEMAGLRDTPATRLQKSARADASRRMHAARYLERFVKPYVASDVAALRELNGESIILSISDTHATYLDPFTWMCFIRAIRDLQLGPNDIVLFNGDTLEGSAISRHPKIPGQTIPLQVELDFQYEMCRQVRATGFDGHLIVNPGNHGLDRLSMYLTQVASGVSDLRSMRIDNLLGLREFDVTLGQGGSFLSPPGEVDNKAGLLLYGFYRVHHGVLLGQNPALGELRAACRSGQSGHVHRASVAFGTTEKERGLSWMTTPMGCTPLAGRSYIKGTNDGWQTGFGVCFLAEGERVHQYPVLTEGGRCHIEGFVYTDPGFELPPFNELWIKDMYDKVLG